MRDKLAVKVDSECNEFIELSKGLSTLEENVDSLKTGYMSTDLEWNEEVYIRINLTLDEIEKLGIVKEDIQNTLKTIETAEWIDELVDKDNLDKISSSELEEIVKQVY